MSDPVAQLNNVTIYVERDELTRMGAFYGELLGGAVIFESEDIRCFEVGIDRAVCVHAAGELGRVAGQIEVIYRIEDLDFMRARATMLGAPMRDLRGMQALEVVDPAGHTLRFLSLHG
jgi:hypothetical protein